MLLTEQDKQGLGHNADLVLVSATAIANKLQHYKKFEKGEQEKLLCETLCLVAIALGTMLTLQIKTADVSVVLVPRAS